MKKYLLLLALFTGVFAAAQKPIPDDWKVDAKQAMKMVEYYNNCEGDCFTSKITPDGDKEKRIREMFPDARSFEWTSARYTKEDVGRYAKRRGADKRSPVSLVSGYATRLLTVVDAEGNTHYFDIVSLCPPPSGCDEVAQ